MYQIDNLHERIVTKYYKRTGIKMSLSTVDKVMRIFGKGVSQILGREGFINLGKLGRLEYRILTKSEIRFTTGLPILMPTRLQFKYTPSNTILSKVVTRPQHTKRMVWDYFLAIKEKYNP